MDYEKWILIFVLFKKARMSSCEWRTAIVYYNLKCNKLFTAIAFLNYSFIYAYLIKNLIKNRFKKNLLIFETSSTFGLPLAGLCGNIGACRLTLFICSVHALLGISFTCFPWLKLSHCRHVFYDWNRESFSWQLLISVLYFENGKLTFIIELWIWVKLMEIIYQCFIFQLGTNVRAVWACGWLCVISRKRIRRRRIFPASSWAVRHGFKPFQWRR